MSTTATIGASFHHKQENYKQYALAQAQAARGLISLLQTIDALPQGTWIDLGSGPAPLAPLFAKEGIPILPLPVDLATSEGVVADMDALPFLPHTLAGICSSSAFQWSSNINALFTNLTTLLAREGIIAVSLFTEGTLEQLQTLQKTYGITSGVTFASPQQIQEHLSTLPLTVMHAQHTSWEDHFSSPSEALQSLSAIGASPSLHTPLSPQKLRNFMHDYAQLFSGAIVHRYAIFTLILQKNS